jgi:transposase
MKPPLFTRSFAQDEQTHLEDALRSPDAFRLRRAQYLLASSRGLVPRQIAATYGGCEQSVRNVIRAFNATGLDCLTPQSRRPKSAVPQLTGARLEQFHALLRQSPRAFGKTQSVWTTGLLATVAFEQGLTEQTVSDETIRRAMQRLQVNWKRAKHWISSPDPQYTLKKSGESD